MDSDKILLFLQEIIITCVLVRYLVMSLPFDALKISYLITYWKFFLFAILELFYISINDIFFLNCRSCFEWEYPIRSTLAFIGFMVGTYYFEPYMVPIILLIVFLRNYIVSHISRYGINHYLL